MFEIIYGKKPNLEGFKVSGNMVCFHISSQIRNSKFDECAEEGIWVGYC